MRISGTAGTVGYTPVSAPDALIDVASDGDDFAPLASLVHAGGTAVTKPTADGKTVIPPGAQGASS